MSRGRSCCLRWLALCPAASERGILSAAGCVAGPGCSAAPAILSRRLKSKRDAAGVVSLLCSNRRRRRHCGIDLLFLLWDESRRERDDDRAIYQSAKKGRRGHQRGRRCATHGAVAVRRGSGCPPAARQRPECNNTRFAAHRRRKVENVASSQAIRAAAALRILLRGACMRAVARSSQRTHHVKGGSVRQHTRNVQTALEVPRNPYAARAREQHSRCEPAAGNSVQGRTRPKVLV